MSIFRYAIEIGDIIHDNAEANDMSISFRVKI